MKSASKSTLSLNNLINLRAKVTKNLTNLPKKFCEFRPRSQISQNLITTIVMGGGLWRILKIKCAPRISRAKSFV